MSLNNATTGMLDTRVGVATPEGVDLVLTPAGPFPRILAYSIDFLIRSLMMALVAAAAALLGTLGKGPMLITFFLLEWFYPVLFDVFRGGVTPGKRIMKLRVMHEDGTAISFSGSLLRNLLRVVDFLPAFYLTGIVTMVLDGRFRRLGDLAAGTWVVYERREPDRKPLAVEGVKPLPVALSADEQLALIDFADRAGTLSQERRLELVNILAPVLGQKDEAALEALLQTSNGLTGKR